MRLNHKIIKTIIITALSLTAHSAHASFYTGFGVGKAKLAPLGTLAKYTYMHEVKFGFLKPMEFDSPWAFGGELGHTYAPKRSHVTIEKVHGINGVLKNRNSANLKQLTVLGVANYELSEYMNISFKGGALYDYSKHSYKFSSSNSHYSFANSMRKDKISPHAGVGFNVKVLKKTEISYNLQYTANKSRLRGNLSDSIGFNYKFA